MPQIEQQIEQQIIQLVHHSAESNELPPMDAQRALRQNFLKR